MLKAISVSGLIESMRYNGGHSTKQMSTVTMAVSHKFATEVANFIEDYKKKGVEPEEGLIRLELIAHYDDGRESGTVIEGTIEERPDESEEGERIIDDLTDDLDATTEPAPDDEISEAKEGTDD